MASTYAYRTMDLTADGGYTSRFVFSAWVKRSKLGYANAPLFSLHKNNSNTASKINFNFNSSDQLSFTMQDSGGSADSEYQTDRKFRDTSAWYHIYFAFNSTLSTAADRLQIYVNGVRETSFAQANEVSNGFGALMSSSMDFRIGTMKNNSGTAYYFDGLMNSAIFTNYQSGTVDPVTDFGEVDSTTGEWKINTSPDVTYASQGVFVLKNGNSLTDQSGQSNNMTVGGTLTNSLDCPSNVFATWNSLDQYYFWGAAASTNITNGNTTVQSGNSQYSYIPTTLGASSGKYYWEIKPSARNGGTDDLLVGVTSTQAVSTAQTLGWHPNDVAYREDGNKKINNSDTSYGNSYTLNDIIGVAMDLDNNKLYFSKNGVWQNSGDPTSGSTGTGAIPLTASASTELGNYFASVAYVNGSYNATFQANFGNGFFGTSAVADNSTATASTPGTFNYDVPAGYQPLTTKGLNA